MAWEITADELLARYAAGERDFSGVDLMEVALDDIVLENAILRGTRFRWSSLDGAIFSNADLEGADFYLARLDYTDFRGANLRNCNIIETSLIRANFEGAIADGCPLGGYTYKTTLPSGRIVTCADPGRDRAIAEGDTSWDSAIADRVGWVEGRNPKTVKDIG